MKDFLINSSGIISNDFNKLGNSDGLHVENLTDLAENLDGLGIRSEVRTFGNVYDLTRDLGYGREIVASIDSSWFSLKGVKGLLADLFDFERPDFAAFVAKLNLDNPDVPTVMLTNPATGKTNQLPIESFMESVGGARCDYLHTQEPAPYALEHFQANGWSDNHIPTIGDVDFATLDIVNNYYNEVNRVNEQLSDPMNFHTDGHGSFDIDVWMASRGFEPGSREGLEALAQFAEPPVTLPEKPIEVSQLEILAGMPSPEQMALHAQYPEIFNDDSSTPISVHAMNEMADREASMLEKADHAEAMGHHSAAASLRNSAHELGHYMDSGHWD